MKCVILIKLFFLSALLSPTSSRRCFNCQSLDNSISTFKRFPSEREPESLLRREKQQIIADMKFYRHHHPEQIELENYFQGCESEKEKSSFIKNYAKFAARAGTKKFLLLLIMLLPLPLLSMS